MNWTAQDAADWTRGIEDARNGLPPAFPSTPAYRMGYGYGKGWDAVTRHDFVHRDSSAGA